MVPDKFLQVTISILFSMKVTKHSPHSRGGGLISTVGLGRCLHYLEFFSMEELQSSCIVTYFVSHAVLIFAIDTLSLGPVSFHMLLVFSGLFSLVCFLSGVLPLGTTMRCSSLSCTFAILVLEPATSPRSSSSFYWRTEFRSEAVALACLLLVGW